MVNKPKVLIITSDHLRHKYYCNSLATQLNIVGIITESKGPAVSDFSTFSEDDQKIIRKHFGERDAAEKALLGEEISFPETERFQVPFGQSNSRATYEWVKDKNPDFILLYGSSIIKGDILSHFENRIINLHLGLSPYYRGSGTNFWPLVHNVPECVGGTIHLAIEKVDAGSILHQVRPSVEETDRAHQLGTKVIIEAVKAIPSVLEQYAAGNIKPQTQDLSTGKVFRNKDFNAQAVETMWENFDNGMIRELMSHYGERCANYPIVENILQG